MTCNRALLALAAATAILGAQPALRDAVLSGVTQVPRGVPDVPTPSWTPARLPFDLPSRPLVASRL